jgi:hypothetical protein
MNILSSSPLLYYSPPKPYPTVGYYLIAAINVYGSSKYLPVSVNELINDPGGGGGPYFYPYIGDLYFIPHEENCYLLYDNQDAAYRLIITAKLWFLPENIKNTAPYLTNFMSVTTFIKYINIYYKGENLTIDMETFNPVTYTNMSDVSNFSLVETYNQNENIYISDFVPEKMAFRKYYNIIRVKKYRINFNGKYKIINLENKFQIKLTQDLNCADYRNEIILLNGTYENAIGSFVIQNPNTDIIDYLIPNI